MSSAKSHRYSQALECLPCAEKLRDRSWLSLEQRWLWLGAYEAAIKKMEPGSSQCGNTHRLKQEQLRQYKEKLFTVRTVKQSLPI